MEKIDGSFKKILQDNELSLNKEALDLCLSSGWLNEWEYKFCVDTMRKRNLTVNQILKRMQINNKCIKNYYKHKQEGINQ